MLGERHFHPIALRPRGGLLVGQWPGHPDQPEDSALVAFARWYSEQNKRTLKGLLLEAPGLLQRLRQVGGPAGSVPGARQVALSPRLNHFGDRATSAPGPRQAGGGMGSVAALGAELAVRILLFVAFL